MRPALCLPRASSFFVDNGGCGCGNITCGNCIVTVFLLAVQYQDEYACTCDFWRMCNHPCLCLIGLLPASWVAGLQCHQHLCVRLLCGWHRLKTAAPNATYAMLCVRDKSWQSPPTVGTVVQTMVKWWCKEDTCATGWRHLPGHCGSVNLLHKRNRHAPSVHTMGVLCRCLLAMGL